MDNKAFDSQNRQITAGGGKDSFAPGCVVVFCQQDKGQKVDAVAQGGTTDKKIGADGCREKQGKAYQLCLAACLSLWENQLVKAVDDIDPKGMAANKDEKKDISFHGGTPSPPFGLAAPEPVAGGIG